jgi:hypothetical protein
MSSSKKITSRTLSKLLWKGIGSVNDMDRARYYRDDAKSTYVIIKKKNYIMNIV